MEYRPSHDRSRGTLEVDLCSPDERIVVEALIDAGMYGDPAWVMEAALARQGDPRTYVRSASLQAIGLLAMRHALPPDPRVEAAVVRGDADTEPFVRSCAGDLREDLGTFEWHPRPSA